MRRLLQDIIHVHYGKALKAEDRDETGIYPVYGSFGKIGNHHKRLIDYPTLIIGRKGSVGAITYASQGGWPIDTAFYIEIIDKSSTDLKYLYYALKQAKLDQYTITTSIPGINRNDIYKTSIPLPPLPEQQRIAAILGKADALREKRRRTIAKLDELQKSVFLEMFGDPVSNPKGWEVGVLGDVIYSAKDGPHVSPKYSDSGIPFLSTRHVRPGKVIWEDLKYISFEEAKTHWKKCNPEKGDILYTKGGTTGIAKVIDFDQKIAVWVHVAILKVNPKAIDPIWLECMLNSAYCYNQSQELTHGIANRDLGLTRMVKIKLYIPPLQEQQKFAAYADQLRKLEQKFINSSNYLNNLFLSLQQRAFSGELFAQQANEELDKVANEEKPGQMSLFDLMR